MGTESPEIRGYVTVHGLVSILRSYPRYWFDPSIAHHDTPPIYVDRQPPAVKINTEVATSMQLSPRSQDQLTVGFTAAVSSSDDRGTEDIVKPTPEERHRAGKAVQHRINHSGLTITEVAAAAGIHPKTLRALINGTRWPTEDVRAAVERILGWPAGETFRQAKDGVEALAAFSNAELSAELTHRLQRGEVGEGKERTP